MAPPETIVLAFDAYGTLLSTASIADQLSSHFGTEKASAIAAQWRLYQLEYTWRLNSMNKYEPFDSVTKKALIHALTEASVSLSEPDIEKLMCAYNTLNLFPDVPPLFTRLSSPEPSSSPSLHSVIFTNGTPAMLSATLTHSPEISPHAHLFKEVVSIHDIQKYKPTPDAYNYLCKKVDKTGKEGEVWLISGNPFDIVGANAVGMSTVWVDRSQSGWSDRLGEEPTVVVKGLGEVVGKVLEYSSRL
ncbi:haloacid dehalogenase, type II [Amniculicola lignicola CBS 123094]|uniref:Haloacid dehalogenase, type II n=1 Tax=Amniculicola lignicola CBS 123094 TaxID=1392246 RepID=A0A6A5X4Y7_9PLEO|nr:haloacid dehalogenase, type II [Amniculicola lignicola CBS 123094]